MIDLSQFEGMTPGPWWVELSCRRWVVQTGVSETYIRILSDTSRKAHTTASAIAALPDLIRELAETREALAKAQKDAERLDALEALVNEHGELLLHNGSGSGKGFIGLGLANTGRTLREAPDGHVPMKENGQ